MLFVLLRSDRSSNDCTCLWNVQRSNECLEQPLHSFTFEKEADVLVARGYESYVMQRNVFIEREDSCLYEITNVHQNTMHHFHRSFEIVARDPQG